MRGALCDAQGAGNINRPLPVQLKLIGFMRAIHLCLAACFWLPLASTSSAGVYSPGDQIEQPIDIQKPLTPREFRPHLAQLGSLATMPPGQPTKDRYLGRQ